jgi:hypothetical protein
MTFQRLDTCNSRGCRAAFSVKHEQVLPKEIFFDQHGDPARMMSSVGHIYESSGISARSLPLTSSSFTMAYDSPLSTLRQSSINSIAMENGPFINDLLFQMVLFLVFRRKLLDWQRARLHPSPLGVSDLQEVLWQQHDERFAGLGARGRERGTGAQPSPAQ